MIFKINNEKTKFERDFAQKLCFLNNNNNKLKNNDENNNNKTNNDNALNKFVKTIVHMMFFFHYNKNEKFVDDVQIHDFIYFQQLYFFFNNIMLNGKTNSNFKQKYNIIKKNCDTIERKR